MCRLIVFHLSMVENLGQSPAHLLEHTEDIVTLCHRLCRLLEHQVFDLWDRITLLTMAQVCAFGKRHLCTERVPKSRAETPPGPAGSSFRASGLIPGGPARAQFWRVCARGPALR